MAIARIPKRPGLVVLLLGLGGSVLGAGEGRADRIILRGGGQIRGKVIPDPDRPDCVILRTETGKTPLSFQKPQIVRVVAEPSALDDYVVRWGKAAMTAEGNTSSVSGASSTSCPTWPNSIMRRR